MFLVSGVDLVAPLASLLIEILPIGEGTSGQEVPFDKVEGPLHARRAVGMAELMGHEVKAETLGEGGHLGHGNHLATGAAQHHDMRVVKEGPASGAGEVRGVLGENPLAVKARERGLE